MAGALMQVLAGAVRVAWSLPRPLPRLVSRVHAGFPSPADDWIEDDIDLTQLMVGNQVATFLWTVAGDCMVGAGIFDGDILVVDRSLEPCASDVVVVLINAEPSVKRLVRGGDRLALAIDNPSMPPFRLPRGADVSLWGVVRWTLRRHPGASR